ncbi:MAG: hypothetical protein AB7G93_18795 [Bdellovibrionales bacterium]
MESTIAALCVLLFAGTSEAKIIRATEINGAGWASLSDGAAGDTVIEFRRGDELPVTLSAAGDLIETTRSATSYVGVKRDFWLKIQPSEIQISLDGTTFRDLGDVLYGGIEAGAGSEQNGGVADLIKVVFKSFLK